LAKPLSYRDVVKILKAHDPRFEFFVNRGKGSERMIYHPDVNGRPASHPVKHHGDGTELRQGVLSSLIRRFALPRNIFS
jgi:predicted RNA binding protein YcfA (HicA-like mRNA interferase family)